MALLATALMCTAMSPGCGAPPGPIPQPGPVPFAISYERSGGLKPMPQKLVIRPGLHAALTASRVGSPEPRMVHFQVGAKRVESLRRALARAEFGTIGDPGPNPGVCADCFFYAIRYRGHEVSFSQVSVPQRLSGVVGQLEAVIAAHS
jgi:hypothetical protein